MKKSLILILKVVIMLITFVISELQKTKPQKKQSGPKFQEGGIMEVPKEQRLNFLFNLLKENKLKSKQNLCPKHRLEVDNEREKLLSEIYKIVTE